MRLFHASSVIVENPDVLHSREHLDFGKGFYLTTLYEQAEKYARRFLFRGGHAYINEYMLDEELPGFRIRTFDKYNAEWLDFVGNCRKGIPQETFDIVEGGIANDKVFNTVDLYFSGNMSREDALGRLTFEHPNHQLCILNQDVIVRHLHFVGVEEVKGEGGQNASR